jgi:hypothetical protein
VEICPAISTTSCNPATAIGDDIDCTTFTAKFRDPVKPAGAGGCLLKASTKTITVQHDDINDGMVVGADLLLARHSDGYWFVIKWICDT